MVATQQSSKREPSQFLCDWLDSYDVTGCVQLPAPPHCDLMTSLTTTPLSLVEPALKSTDLGSNAASENVLL